MQLAWSAMNINFSIGMETMWVSLNSTLTQQKNSFILV